MSTGAASPEELETLLEDAYLLHDELALAELFAGDAVLRLSDRPLEVKGRPAIASRIDDIWRRGGTYLSHDPLIVQSGPTALVLAGPAVHVVSRATGGWQYLITWLGSSSGR